MVNLFDWSKIYVFLKTWEAMSFEGQCDALNSAEFKRVFTAWLESDYASQVRAFIYGEANRLPDGRVKPLGVPTPGPQPAEGAVDF